MKPLQLKKLTENADILDSSLPNFFSSVFLLCVSLWFFFCFTKSKMSPTRVVFEVWVCFLLPVWGQKIPTVKDIKKLHNRASEPSTESIFIFPKILAGEQGAALSTSILRCNPILSVKDHNLSQLRQVGESSFLTRYFKNFPKHRLLWSNDHIQNKLQELSLCVLKRDRETTTLIYRHLDLAQPYHPFAARIKSTSCGKVCSAGGTLSGFTK